MSDVNVRSAASRKALRWMMMAGAFAVASAAMMISAQAQEGPGVAPPPGQMGPGRFHHVRMEAHGAGGGMMMFGGSPEQIARHVDHMLDGLNATDAQRTQIKQIAQAAAADLKAQREA
ncbi:MAG TPA: hypothetical protein VIO33_03435, partial [Burkholderiaceae bacterium]